MQQKIGKVCDFINRGLILLEMKNGNALWRRNNKRSIALKPVMPTDWVGSPRKKHKAISMSHGC
jgi:hypothetical protein